jgi:DNA-directed RNA polymerase specialized sigma24 family protein
MATGDPGSVSRWLGDLKAGDEAAVQPLWERYFSRLVRLARAKLRSSQGVSGAGDEEDAALSAFTSFCDGVARGRFPRLADRDDLWRLLVVITARKVGAQRRHEGRRKRGGGRVVAASGVNAEDTRDVLGTALAAGPSPDFAAAAAEEFRRLLDLLDDDQLRRVALDRLEGYTNDEIADRLGCARRTVARRLDLIKQVWQSEVDG